MALVTDIIGLRKFFGLSQEFLASYFGVSRSMLNMAERSERYLPLPATTKLAALMQFANAQPIPALEEKTIADSIAADKNKELLGLATNCGIMVYKLQKQLSEAKVLYGQAVQAKALAEYLTANPVNKKEKKDLTLWLQVLQNDAEKKEKRYGPTAQALLQWKLDWYAYGEQRAKELAGEK